MIVLFLSQFSVFQFNTLFNVLGDIRLVVWKTFNLFKWYHRIHTELDILYTDLISLCLSILGSYSASKSVQRKQPFSISTFSGDQSLTTLFSGLLDFSDVQYIEICCPALWSVLANSGLTFAVYAFP